MSRLRIVVSIGIALALSGCSREPILTHAAVAPETPAPVRRAIRVTGTVQAVHVFNVQVPQITGQGGKFFCSGGDVKAYRALDSEDDLQRVFGRVRDLLDEIECFRLPVLAAIDGYALGGGLELALACDQRFASADARLGTTQARLGLIPGWNGVERLVETVGRPHALRLLFLAEPISAARALDIGLVDEVASSGTALDAALHFCRRMASTGPLGVEGAKAVAFAGLASQRAAGREVARRTFERLWFTNDHREAEAAFAEKRPAMLKGH